jgi:hypothetical protein
MTALPSPGKASSSGEMTFPVDSRMGVVRLSGLSGDRRVSIDFYDLRRVGALGGRCLSRSLSRRCCSSVLSRILANRMRPIAYDAPRAALSQSAALIPRPATTS